MPDDPKEPEALFTTPEEEALFITPEEKGGILSEHDASESQMRADWGGDVRKYIRYTTVFTMVVIAIALALDIILVLFQIDSDPADRLLNTQVLLALIAASVAQIGAIAFLIGKSIFK